MKVPLNILALLHGINGLVMLAAPAEWYRLVPGVTGTGPLNVHFIRDIGLGFLAAALALFLSANASGARQIALLACASVFLGGHALLHIVELAVHGGAYLRDMVTILLPGLLPLFILIWTQRRAET